MIHHYLNDDLSGDHYGVAPSATGNRVLLQVQDSEEQVRIALTKKQTEHLITLLQSANEKIGEYA